MSPAHLALFTLPWWAPFAVAIALSPVVIAIEIKTENIPNGITLGLLVAAGCAAILEMKMGSHFGGFVLSAIVCGVLYRQDLLGGGTVKWTCALCTLLGLRDGGVMMLVAGILFGGWIALGRLRGRLLTWAPSTPFLLVGVLGALANAIALQRGWW